MTTFQDRSRRQVSSLLIVFAALTLFSFWPQALRAQSSGHAEHSSGNGETDANRELFSNFLHNAVLGKFDRASAFAQKLLANNPDPVAVMKYADEHTNSLKTLILLVNKVEVSDSAKKVLELIQEGERLQRQDPGRIKLNIEKLGGDPQTEFNAINRLRESGEYAIPWLLGTLQDNSKTKLHSRIIRMLPKMGKEAVNPLCISLSMKDNNTKQYVARTLGEIGYPQAVPYLRAVLEDRRVTAELLAVVETALLKISPSSGNSEGHSAADAFLELARQYYMDRGSVQADPRLNFANVWYWTEGQLQRLEAPREIFNEIMAMRCCEEALRLQSGTDEAVAVWLAANIRREAELGMNVESVEGDPAASGDPTKVENFPRSTYFTRAAGARYCHMVLDLAVRDHEPAVALGAIAALRLIAGETNLIGSEDYKQPLAMALTFADSVVRMKAALALAHALPTTPYAGSDRVVPLLAETLSQTGGRVVLVIDPDQSNLNRVMNLLRDDQTIVIGESGLYTGLDRARNELPTVTAILLATGVTEPALATAIATLRDNHQFAMTPIILLASEGQIDQANRIAKGDPGIASVVALANKEELARAWQGVSGAVGQTSLKAAEALALALDSVEALRKIAFSRSTVYSSNIAEGALIDTLRNSPSEELQTKSASVLALSASSASQEALAKLAMDSKRTESLRVAVFDSLAESAKVNGNLLSEALVDSLIDMAINEPNLTLRSAASQALGALNLPSNKASQIIDKYYRG